MSQAFLFYVGPADQLDRLADRLRSEGFDVNSAARSIPGVFVRIRQDSADEATVERIAAQTAPGAKRGPDGSPSRSVVGYRDGRL